MRRLASVMILGVALHGTGGPATTAQSTSLAAQVDRLADSLFETQLALYPEMGTDLGLPGAEHGRVTDYSLDGVRKAQEKLDALYTEARAIDPALLRGHSQEVTYAVLREGHLGTPAPRHLHFIAPCILAVASCARLFASGSHPLRET